MKKLNKKIRRAFDMIERYHLTTCPDVRMKDEVPAWAGYSKEAVKYSNHAEAIAEFIYSYCNAHGMKTVDFYATKEGYKVKKFIAFCHEISEEFAKRG